MGNMFSEIMGATAPKDTGILPTVMVCLTNRYKSARDAPADWTPNPMRLEPALRLKCADDTVVWAHPFVVYAAFDVIDRGAIWTATDGSPYSPEHFGADCLNLIGPVSRDVEYSGRVVRALVDMAYGEPITGLSEEDYGELITAMDFLGMRNIEYDALEATMVKQFGSHVRLFDALAGWYGDSVFVDALLRKHADKLRSHVVRIVNGHHNLCSSTIANSYYSDDAAHQMFRRAMSRLVAASQPFSVRKNYADAIAVLDIMWLMRCDRSAEYYVGKLLSYITDGIIWRLLRQGCPVYVIIRMYMSMLREYFKAVMSDIPVSAYDVTGNENAQMAIYYARYIKLLTTIKYVAHGTGIIGDADLKHITVYRFVGKRMYMEWDSVDPIQHAAASDECQAAVEKLAALIHNARAWSDRNRVSTELSDDTGKQSVESAKNTLEGGTSGSGTSEGSTSGSSARSTKTSQAEVQYIDDDHEFSGATLRY